MQLARSLLFNLSIYVAMALVGLWYAPQAVFRRDKALEACKVWCRYVMWAAERLIGLRTEISGTPPEGEVLIAAKHQSFLDIVMIFSAVPRGRFIMKNELRWAPVLGWFALRIGCVPVRRGKRAEAMRRMLADVAAGRTEPGQLIIYPQGTRVAPGVPRPYKVGTYVLYAETGQPCVPVGCNVGVFWPRRGFLRHPGTAVVEFLDPIPPGLSQAEFMERMSGAIEESSDRLMAEAGFRVPSAPGPLEEA